MPTREDEQPGDSLPLALQSLFFKLQYGAAPPSTKDLTRSFGWSSLEAFQQHDVQELNRVLCEKLEEKMKVRGNVVGTTGFLNTV
jgi:ubiquitin carboxyl-terminal hydrolase 7